MNDQEEKIENPMNADYQEEIENLINKYPLGSLDSTNLCIIIKQLLDLCEQAIGVQNKRNIAIHIYRYITYNFWFLINNNRFNQSVVNKTIEQKRDFKDESDFQEVKFVSNFLEKFEKLKPFQIDQQEAEKAYQIMLKEEDTSTISALFNLALQRSYMPFVFKLIDHPKLEINCQNNKGDTPLIHACRNGLNIQLIKQIIDLGANPKITNKKGQTAGNQAAYQNVKDYLDSLK